MRMSKETVQREKVPENDSKDTLFSCLSRVSQRVVLLVLLLGGGRVGHLRATLIATGIEILGWLTQIHVS